MSPTAPLVTLTIRRSTWWYVRYRPKNRFRSPSIESSRLAVIELASQSELIRKATAAEVHSSITEACQKAADKALNFDSYLSRASLLFSRSKRDLAEGLVGEWNRIVSERIIPLANSSFSDLHSLEVSYHESLLTTGAPPLFQIEHTFSVDGVLSQDFFDALSSSWSFGRKFGEDAFEFVPYIGTTYGLSRAVYDYRTETRIIKPAQKYCKRSLEAMLENFDSKVEEVYENVSLIHARFSKNWDSSHALATR